MKNNPERVFEIFQKQEIIPGRYFTANYLRKSGVKEVFRVTRKAPKLLRDVFQVTPEGVKTSPGSFPGCPETAAAQPLLLFAAYRKRHPASLHLYIYIGIG
jgi:hypothetical protein